MAHPQRNFAPMKTRRLKNILLSGFIVIALGATWIIYHILHTSDRQSSFISEVVSSFNRTASNTILISEFVGGEWDTVCAFPQYNLLPWYRFPPWSDARRKEFEKAFGYDYEAARQYFPGYWNPTFHGSLVFFLRRQFVDAYVFDTWGLSQGEGKFKTIYNSLPVRGKPSYFLPEWPTKNDLCIGRHDAALALVGDARFQEYLILVTNIKKEAL